MPKHYGKLAIKRKRSHTKALREVMSIKNKGLYMTKILSIAIFLVLTTSCQNELPTQAPKQTSAQEEITSKYKSLGYELVWQEEFNSNGSVESSKWDFEQGFQRNHELQWYQEDNAFCEDGKLFIEARREMKANPGFKAGSKQWKEKRKNIYYTSSCLTSKQSWKYGRFEIKARLKAADGLWPAIWFLGTEGQWPSNGEIDLMEYYNDMILANACWGTKRPYQAKWDSSKTAVKDFKDPDWDKKFHIWRMDWDKDSIKLFLDDQLLNTIDLKKAINPDASRGPKEPFQQAHYLLLNLAIGGTNGGDPSSTPFPSRFEVDYVRIYQK